MSNIPTAEEMFEANPIILPGVTRQAVIAFMRVFAKLHVEAALEEAAENAQAFQSCKDGDPIIISKGSIINSYPLTNIK